MLIVRAVLVLALSIFLTSVLGKERETNDWGKPRNAPEIQLRKWLAPNNLVWSHANLPIDIMRVYILSQRSSWEYHRELPGLKVTKLRGYIVYSPSEDRYYIISIGNNWYVNQNHVAILEVKKETDQSREERRKRSQGKGIGNPDTSLFKMVGAWDYDGPSIYALNVSPSGVVSVPAPAERQYAGRENVENKPANKPENRVATRDCTKEGGLALIKCLAEQASAVGAGR